VFAQLQLSSCIPAARDRALSTYYNITLDKQTAKHPSAGFFCIVIYYMALQATVAHININSNLTSTQT
jgi:hypothetical protein